MLAAELLMQVQQVSALKAGDRSRVRQGGGRSYIPPIDEICLSSFLLGPSTLTSDRQQHPPSR